MDYTLPPIPLQTDRDFLNDEELVARVESFLVGPCTLENAAKEGLLALAVIPAFGGLYASDKRRLWALQAIYMQDQWLARTIKWHHFVCSFIYEIGTHAQFDFYLPQLASGKRIGYRIPDYHRSGTVTESGEISRLSVWGRFSAWAQPDVWYRVLYDWRDNWRIDPMAMLPPGFVVLDANILNDEPSTNSLTYVIPTELLRKSPLVPKIHAHIGGKHRISINFDGYFPSFYRLGSRDGYEASNEKWRAIRWKTAPSES